MTDFTDSCITPDVGKSRTRLVISPETSAYLASQSVSSSSLPEAAAVDDDELKKVDRLHGHELEKAWTCRNISSGNANITQEVPGYQICNKETILKGEESDPDADDHDKCGMLEELLFEILLRLPVRSLVRLRSVCKSWCSLTDSSMFNHNPDKDSLIAVEYFVDDDSSKLCLLSGSKYEVYSDLECELVWNACHDVSIGNCCNGVVCLVNTNRGIAYLWNPALKQKKRLPESTVSVQSLVLCREYYLTFGFGYDVKSNDYKVVKIDLKLEKWGTHKSLVEVYSLRGDSWKIIQVALPVADLVDEFTPRQTLSMNGKCYWAGCVDTCNEVLVCFDLNGERFETMGFPGEANLEFPPYHALDLLGGKLVCMKGMGNNWPYDSLDPTYFEIWVLQDEDGATKCWNKLCKLGPTCHRCYETRLPLAFSRNGQFLLFSNSTGSIKQLLLYDFATGEEGYVEIQDPNPCLLSFYHYTESLVSLL